MDKAKKYKKKRDDYFMRSSSMLWMLTSILVVILAGLSAFSSSGVQAIIRFSGLSGFAILSITLIMGPIIMLKPKWAEMLESRRALGLAGFYFILLHVLLVSYAYFNFDINQVTSQLPLLIGLIAFILVIPIAITSSDRAIALLGSKNWKRIQRIAYIVFILALIHFILKSNVLMGQNIGGLIVGILGIIAILLQIFGFLKRKKILK